MAVDNWCAASAAAAARVTSSSWHVCAPLIRCNRVWLTLHCSLAPVLPRPNAVQIFILVRLSVWIHFVSAKNKLSAEQNENERARPFIWIISTAWYRNYGIIYTNNFISMCVSNDASQIRWTTHMCITDISGDKTFHWHLPSNFIIIFFSGVCVCVAQSLMIWYRHFVGTRQINCANIASIVLPNRDWSGFKAKRYQWKSKNSNGFHENRATFFPNENHEIIAAQTADRRHEHFRYSIFARRMRMWMG